jgi:hypothetical protein
MDDLAYVRRLASRLAAASSPARASTSTPCQMASTGSSRRQNSAPSPARAGSRLGPPPPGRMTVREQEPVDLAGSISSHAIGLRDPTACSSSP